MLLGSPGSSHSPVPGSVDSGGQASWQDGLIIGLNGTGDKDGVTFSEKIAAAFLSDRKLLICGNGGSAADAQHIAAEFVCRFNFERPGLPAMALATNYSMITAAGNDYSFEDVFAREVEANGRGGDIFIGISTSGNSANVLRAMQVCRRKDIFTIGLAGAGGAIQQAAELCLSVPSECTPRIQECHILIGHILCEIVENTLFEPC